MSRFQRLKTKLYVFFKVDLPLFMEGRSLFTKISLGCLGVVLAQIILGVLFIAAVLGFVTFMSWLNSNKTYKLLYPVEEIAAIQIVQIDDSISIYGNRLEEIPEMLDQRTTVIASLEDTQITACTQDLFALPASRWWNDPMPYIEGGTLLITYRNGSREWICARGSFYYDTVDEGPGLTWYFFSLEVFSSFLQRNGYSPPQ